MALARGRRTDRVGGMGRDDRSRPGGGLRGWRGWSAATAATPASRTPARTPQGRRHGPGGL